MIVRLIGNALETNVKGTKMSERASDKHLSSASGLGGEKGKPGVLG